MKCEPIFDFGTGPRNAAYFNPHGNILCLAGYGNLQGGIDLWDLDAQKPISRCKIPDTTYVEWAPDGMHIITATLSPRLRIGNGYVCSKVSAAVPLYPIYADQLFLERFTIVAMLRMVAQVQGLELHRSVDLSGGVA